MAFLITIHMHTYNHLVDRVIHSYLAYLFFTFREAGLVERAGGRACG